MLKQRYKLFMKKTITRKRQFKAIWPLKIFTNKQVGQETKELDKIGPEEAINISHDAETSQNLSLNNSIKKKKLVIGILLNN